MTERPNDPAAELTSARVLAKNASGRIDGKAAYPDVAAFVAARAAALATPEPADDLSVDGHADPAPLLDPAPDPDPAAPPLLPRPDARPRIVEDPVILGLTRVSRSKLGSRLFTLFFVIVYAVILVQLVVSLLLT